ncbi:HAD-IIIA family hydrolase [Daejeonella sp.]|uniref:KdsC family phosphatase n=1 Tax=Daejeonella sp. TaxID=2805397 RepID=UPI0030BCD5D6
MFLEKIKHIKAFILDVDGVLTDGTVLVTETGEQHRRFNIKDGYALQLAVKRGYYVVAVSGGRSKGIELRLKGLGITEVFLGLDSKIEAYYNFLKSSGLSPEEILYMGDDIPDLSVTKLVGLATCPADAVEEIKAVCHYISPKNGGEGCVRDIIEKVMKIRGDWHDESPSAHDGSLN